MPIGFVFLGLILIAVLIFYKNIFIKILYSILCILAMIGFFVEPTYFSWFSINFFFFISAIFLFFAGVIKTEINSLWIITVSVIVGVGYYVLISIDYGFVASINPIPISILLTAFGVLFIKNARAVIAYFGLSIILVSVIALISETCIGYVNLFGSELFNIILIGLTIDLTISGLLSRHRLLKSSHAKIND